MHECPIACRLAKTIARLAVVMAAGFALLTPQPAAAKEPLRMPSGAPLTPWRSRPTTTARVCSFEAPLCVHGRPADGPLMASIVARAASSYLALIEQLGMPAALDDRELDPSGDGRLDLYLDDLDGLDDLEGRGGPGDQEDRGARAQGDEPRERSMLGPSAGFTIEQGPLAKLTGRDAAPGFARLDRGLLATGGCLAESTLVRALFRLDALALDVAEAPAMLEAASVAVAHRLAPCPTLEAPLIEARSARPGRALGDDAAHAYWLLEGLERTRGSERGELVPATLALATQAFGVQIPLPDDDLGPAHFRDDPGMLDVLDATLQTRKESLADALLDLAADAIAAPADPAHRPALEWTVKASSLPRNLGVRSAVRATGATYVRVDLDARPADETLAFDVKWELHAQMHWRALKLAPDGHLLGAVTPGVLLRATEQTVEIRHLEGASAVVLVGIDAGDPDRPYRAADPPFLPHGYEVAIFAGAS
jgi:hypothetical protein